jgi:hypothetical protein
MARINCKTLRWVPIRGWHFSEVPPYRSGAPSLLLLDGRIAVRAGNRNTLTSRRAVILVSATSDREGFVVLS